MKPDDKDYSEKINQRFQQGADSFSEKDLDKVLAEEETVRNKARNVKGLFDEFILAVSLLKDFKKGIYKAPWKCIAALGFTIAYLVMPVDLIPDFIPGLGFIDDASVFGLALAAFKSEIENYRQWKYSPKNK